MYYLSSSFEIRQNPLKQIRLRREHLSEHHKYKASLQLKKKLGKNIARDKFNYKCSYCGKKFLKPSQVILIQVLERYLFI